MLAADDDELRAAETELLRFLPIGRDSYREPRDRHSDRRTNGIKPNHVSLESDGATTSSKA